MLRNPLLTLACATLTSGPGLPANPQDHEPAVRQPLPSPDVIATLPSDGGPEFNRLVFEQSPYLLQHARNPVDWYPWGDDAFRAAKAQNKPIFLSIGYSTCHWCHVMEHESFEDPEVARLMNEAFLCVKVDREERPDLDHVYMTITQAMNNGQGGWPMTVVMTPDRKPFFAGTYFPKAGRYGRWGMVDLIPKISEVWTEQRDQVLAQADNITAQLGNMMHGQPGGDLDEAVSANAMATIAAQFDVRRGGFGTSPKFPLPHKLRFLLRRHARTGDAQALEMVAKTLREMRKGGIWDHVGFGFHRYSTDAEWLVPHFEKMLYDQALMTMALVEAWQVSGDDELQRTAREVLTYVTRDMTSPEGGFYSAEDADSEGEEGLFYLWTTPQLVEVLGEDDAALAASVWSATVEGNFLDEATKKKNGRNILHLTRTLGEIAEQRDEELGDLEARMENIRGRLFAVREGRIHPLKDDKILTDWNGLMIAAFAQASRAFDDPAYAEVAKGAADHVLGSLRREDGRLFKLARLGVPAGEGLLEDYAFVALGMLELFETVQDPRYLRAAVELTERMIADFSDEERGGFFLSPEGGEELIVRPKEVYDGAIPSGNSVAIWNLMRLSRLTGRTAYAELASEAIRAFGGDIRRTPAAYTQLLIAHEFALGPTREIVIAGQRGADDTNAMLRALHGSFSPNKVVLLRAEGESEELVALVPFLAEQGMLDGAATAYVCENFACQAPTNDVTKLLEELARPAESDD